MRRRSWTIAGALVVAASVALIALPARSSGADLSTDDSWGMILSLTDGAGEPITVTPGEDDAVEPNGLLRSIVADGSVTAGS